MLNGVESCANGIIGINQLKMSCHGNAQSMGRYAYGFIQFQRKSKVDLDGGSALFEMVSYRHARVPRILDDQSLLGPDWWVCVQMGSAQEYPGHEIVRLHDRLIKPERVARIPKRRQAIP